MLSDKEQMEIIKKVMSDKTVVPIQIDISDAWLLLSALQLVYRHPELSQFMKDAIFAYGDKFAERIIENHPAAAPLIQMGWDVSYDVEADSDD